jgi:hypothetical protein
MITTLILRFRDLVTPSSGTIQEHQRIAQKHENVWWGWWKRQTERTPTDDFKRIHEYIVANKKPIPAFVFDSGSETLYLTKIYRIAVAPEGSSMRTPDAKKSPEYYHRGEYTAWLLLGPFSKVSLAQVFISYKAFSTNPEIMESDPSLFGQRITNPTSLRRHDATLYIVDVDEDTLTL